MKKRLINQNKGVLMEPKKILQEDHGNMTKTRKHKQQLEEIMKLKLILNENLMIKIQAKVILIQIKRNRFNLRNFN